MIVKEAVQCCEFPCRDVCREAYTIPPDEVDPQKISLVMISESAPPVGVEAESLYKETTVQAFVDAGITVASIQDIRDLGIYLTTAVKCGKTGYGIERQTIETCAGLLAQELALFPNVQVYMLMGNVAIKAFNAAAKQAGEKRVIPAGATYKIRSQAHFYRGRRVFPSYLQAGPAFFIEKSKRRMIAEDIARAMQLLRER